MVDLQENTLIVIVGPTAIGKTRIAIELAQWLGTVIVSADSRQIYEEMRIGTAVPTPDELQAVPHFFIQSQSVHDYYNASMFETGVLQELNTQFRQHRQVIMAGGSGMYVDAVCYGIDDLPTIEPALRQRLIRLWETEGIGRLQTDLQTIDPDYYAQADLNNPKRLLKALEVYYMTGKPYSQFRTDSRKKRPFKILKIGLKCERQQIYERINQRVDEMIRAGLVEEARKLYPYKKLNALNTVGYKELFAYFDGRHDLKTAIKLIKRDTRRFAKRQLSWFARDKSTYWFHPNEWQAIQRFVKQDISS